MLFSDGIVRYNETNTYMYINSDSKTYNTSAVSAPLSSASYTALACFMFLIFIVSILFNGVFIYIFFIHDKLKTRSNILLVALCISSFLISALAIPFVGASALAHRWLFGNSGCVFHGFVVTSLGLTQIGILTVLSIDKYIIIVKHNWSHLVTKSSTLILVFACVLYGFMFASYPLLGWNRYTYEVANISCSINWDDRSTSDLSYSICLLVVGLFIPLCIMIYAYGSILLMVKNQRLLSERMKGPSQTAVAFKRQVRVVKTVCLIVVFFIVSWSPYSIYSILSVIGYADRIDPVIATLPSMFAKASIIWHPIIYVCRNRNFKKALGETIPCFACFCSFLSRCQENWRKRENLDTFNMINYRATSGSDSFRTGVNMETNTV